MLRSITYLLTCNSRLVVSLWFYPVILKAA